jgi:hypothetical protein
MLKEFLFFILVSFCFADTNDINYKDFLFKEAAQEKMEDFYFLKVFDNKKIITKLTGENIIDYNGFNTINRVRTYTTIKINF